MSDAARSRAPALERAQVGIRLEKRLTKVLKGLAEYLDVSLNVLVESILLHAVASDEDVIQPPWRTRKSRLVCANLMGVYGLDEVDLADLLLIGQSDKDSPKGRLLVSLRAGRAEEALTLLQTHPELKNAVDGQGFPVIVSAARIDAVPILEWCIANGVDPEVKDEEYEDTALGWAVFYGKLRAAEWLLARGVSHSHTDNEGFTPLANAIRGQAGKLAKFGVRASEADFEKMINLLRQYDAAE